MTENTEECVNAPHHTQCDDATTNQQEVASRDDEDEEPWRECTLMVDLDLVLNK